MKYLLTILFWLPVLLYGQFNLRWLADKSPHQVINVSRQAGKQAPALLFVISTGAGGRFENVRTFSEGRCRIEEKYKYAGSRLISEEVLEYAPAGRLLITYSYDASGRPLQKEERKNQVRSARERWRYYKDSLVYERLEYKAGSRGYLVEKEVTTYDALHRVKEIISYMPDVYEIPAHYFYEYKRAGNDSIVQVRELKNGKTDQVTDSIFNAADQQLYKVLFSMQEGATDSIELKQYDSLGYRIVQKTQNNRLLQREQSCCTTGKLALINQYETRNSIRRDFFYNKNKALQKVVLRGEDIAETVFKITYR
jgi:hypothetical protein